MSPEKVAVAVVLVVVAEMVLGDGGKSLSWNLQRASHDGVELSQLRDRDLLRHDRILQQKPPGVVNFDVEGTYDPSVVGLYYTKVQLGTPPKEFYVQIDTGSDVLWVSCNSCNGCPTSTELEMKLKFFDPSSSSTASPLSCSDRRCALGAQTSESGCSDQNKCVYTFQYVDGSGTSGYYISDLMYFNKTVGNSLTSNSSAPVIFGCSTSQTGDLTKSDRAVDGIFGFGQQGLSVISQLSSIGVTPNAFSHCLKGGSRGGGTLVLGQVVEPNMVYTPLVPLQPHYNVNLQSISVKGQTLPIDPTVFATSDTRGTIIDSGTTLAYLADEAYDPFVTAITQAVSQSVHPIVSKGNQCYIITSSVSDIFPPVNLNFAGGASMILKPEDYLVQQNSISDAAVWCLAFQKNGGQGITILGDLVLKDKIVVYDLAGQRIGWANYDCSSVNVSETTSTGNTELFNAARVDSSSSHINQCKLMKNSILACFLQMAIFCVFTTFMTPRE
ncbi:aspartic proteinase-like protein 2 isoform X2 [Olea europaea var. sylvestris]|uniref:aspartic proteinase-like protein 2 isoform X2 n=1 Tax=Olea europaea var. sylvestris TaxID=158386 RepID=UPI000C1D1251|nr:aspartic proteinase-like protein 2 isoform X2 [Olea europaea var. sylvestris]